MAQGQFKLCCEQSVNSTRFKQSSESMDQSAQSVQLITLGVIPLLSALSVAVSQEVMSEISQKIKSVIRVTTMGNQGKVRLSQKEKSARKFNSFPWV
eukprot:3985826-Amphidinium_carterae.1